MSISRLLNFSIFMAFCLNVGISVAQAESISDQEQRSAQKCLEEAKKGDVAAMYCIAFSYRYGIGVKQDYQQSMKWSLKVLESNSNRYSSYAMVFIGDYYYSVEHNKQQAMQWYLKAVDKGSSHAMYQIGNSYECNAFVKDGQKECQQAIHWYLKADSAGDIDASCKLSDIYRYGITKDLDKTLYWSNKCSRVIRD